MTYKIDGITYNRTGGVLGSCDCYLFKYDSGADTLTQVAATTSNSSTGAYAFTGLADNDPAYSVAFYLPGSPDAFDVTNRDITPTIEGAPLSYAYTDSGHAEPSDWGTHSYTINIGTAAADRIVVVFAMNWAAGGNVAALLNGNAMTVCPGATTGGGIDAIAVWYLNVPTGTTANLTLHQLQTAKWGVYILKGQTGGASATPVDGGYVTQAGSGDVSFSLTVPAGGVALMAGFPSASINADITWTNATEDHDATAAQNNSFAHATASATVTSHSADDGYRYTSGGVLWVTWDA